MSPSTGSQGSKKRVTAESASRTADDDHRKRRRNRTTQSCLNCHTSKRMCDRKRPCGRCTQLGLTGLCVYEVDDPSQRSDDQDETSRLQKRVAELEGVIRELKNKPHPRWAQSSNQSGEGGERRSSQIARAEIATFVPDISPLTPSSPTSRSPVVVPALDEQTVHPKFSNSCAFGFPSPRTSPSPGLLTPMDEISQPLLAVLQGQLESPLQLDFGAVLSSPHEQVGGMGECMFGDLLYHIAQGDPGANSYHFAQCGPGQPGFNFGEGHCGCLGESPNYQAVLELSLRLRKAAETLSRSERHCSDTTCPMRRLVLELDAFVAQTLGNFDSVSDMPSNLDIMHSQLSIAVPTINTSMPTTSLLPGAPQCSTVSPESLVAFPTSEQDFSWNDPFMTWVPSR